ncbi:MAG: nitrite/sulfite reductase [Hyphomonadaceae bacterium]
MYRYDEFDETIVRERVAQFRDQVDRRIRGEMTEDQFKQLRLMNGLYLQLHAYMLRIAVPYGTLNARQLEQLAMIARKYDRGYGHFTTRQNIQFNWVKLIDAPDILSDLADVEMHAIQTSGNCIRNTTSDQFAGAAADEVEDPRVWCEIIRQWSTFHPEFSFLPRKFKIAVVASEEDRTAMRTHDIGLRLRKNAAGEIVFDVYVGGGQGRTPFIAPLIKQDLSSAHLLSYLEACLRVYNRYGRRDNSFKARIKILVSSLGPEEYGRQVEAEWEEMREGVLKLPDAEIAAIRAYFTPPAFAAKRESEAYARARIADAAFDRWARTNVRAHKQPGYASATISLKPIGGVPGDASAGQMEAVAAIARRYAFDDVRVSHEQNLVLPHVAQDDLYAVYQALDEAGLATPNAGLISDIIACPGLDYCDLANARAIPVAQEISKRFANLDAQEKIGDLEIKISGCINACGHHHVGHIGILGVDKHGEEFYQILLGGRADEKAKLGKIYGKGMPGDAVPGAIERVVAKYLELRKDQGERFIEAFERIGPQPFEEALYGA